MSARALLVGLLLAGCGAHLTQRWTDLAATVPPARERYPEAAAVGLLEESTGLNVAHGGAWFQEWMWHSVVAILDERGLDAGTLRCEQPPGAELVEFHARVRTPSGEVREVDDEDLFVEEARSAGDTDSAQTRTLLVPGVEVGSVVEYFCRVRIDDSIGTQWFFRAQRPHPVQRFNVELRLSETLRTAARAYGTSTPIARTTDGDFVVHRWSASDLPAEARESEMVHWTEREPWWSLRVLSYRNGNFVHPYKRTWADTLRHEIIALDANDTPLTEGAPAAPGTAICNGLEPCIVDTLWHAAVTLAPAGATTGGPPRRLADAYATGRVTPAERAVLLVHWLRGAGLDARHALAPSRFGFHLDHGFPSPHSFDSLLVYLPANPARGRSQATWLDPHCETCAAGELAPRSIGTDALVVRATRNLVTAPEVEATLVAVTGPLGKVGRIERRHTLSVSPEGGIGVVLSRTFEDLTGWWWWVAHQDIPVKKDADAVADVQQWHDPRTIQGTYERRAFDRRKANSGDTARFQVPEAAARDGDRLVLPLSFLPAEGGDGATELDARRTDLARAYPTEYLDMVTIPPPAGFGIAELPAAVEAHSPMAELSFTATATPEGAVHLERRLLIRAGRFSRADFPAVQEVYRASQALRRTVVVFQQLTPQVIAAPAASAAPTATPAPGTSEAAARP